MPSPCCIKRGKGVW